MNSIPIKQIDLLKLAEHINDILEPLISPFYKTGFIPDLNYLLLSVYVKFNIVC